MDEKILIEHLNNIIHAAIEHGGDIGGAYYSWPDDLEVAINNALEVFSLKDKYTIKWEDINGQPIKDTYGVPTIIPLA